MKILDASLGRLAVMLLPRAVTPVAVPAVKTILIIRPGGIGDAVHLVPMIRCLHKRYPDSAIDILAERRNAAVFNLTPHVRAVYRYDSSAELMQVVRSCYDVVIDTEQWHRLSAVIARLVRPFISIGFATNERARLFMHQIAYSHDTYETDSFLSLLEPLGGHADYIGGRFLEVPGAAALRAGQFLSELGGKPYVTMFPGASIAERRWGGERFRMVAEVLGGLGMCCVVVGGSEDQAQGEEIAAGGAGLNLAGRTSLEETAAVVQKSRLLISGDSGVLHLAVGLGIPTVSLFGPGRAKKWAPIGDKHIVLNSGLPCSPCTTFGTTPPCPADAECMRSISVEEVCRAVAVLLANAEAGSLLSK